MASNDTLQEMSAPLFVHSFNSSSSVKIPVCFIPGFQAALRALEACMWERFAIISFDDVAREIIQRHFLSKPQVSFLHYEIDSKDMRSKVIEDIIWEIYYQQKVPNIILVTDRCKEILDVAQRMFERDRCGHGATMTNRLHFFLVSSSSDISRTQVEMKNSIFDNVALFLVKDNPPYLDKVYTLMWRENRLREFQEITDFRYNLDDEEEMCYVFPNTRNGLNGRHLVGLAKEWLPDFYRVPNHVTGKLEYFGFYTDVFDVLARTLNFTYTLVPPAGEDNNVTWENYVEIVSRCQVDFGINMYTNNAVFQYDATISLPVLYNNFIGVYINQEKPNPYKLVMVFKLETLLAIFGSLFMTMLLYLVITHVQQSQKYGRELNRETSGKTTVNQKQNETVQRSSLYENDWQLKYSRLQNKDMFPYSTYAQSGTKTRLSRQGDQNQTNLSNRKASRNSSVSIIVSEISLNSIFACVDAVKRRIIKFHNTNRKFCPEKMKNTKSYRIQQDVRVKRRQQDVRVNLYSNSSHYITDFSNTIFNTYEYSQHFPEKNTPNENAGKQHLKRANSSSRKAEILGSMCFYEYIIDTAFRLIGTLLNQATLPQTQQVSPRVLMGAWSLMTIVVIATYTGNLTATFVDDTAVVPIKTFDELIANGNFRWGVINDTVVYSLMKESEAGTTLHKLYEGIKHFSKTDPTVMGSLDELIENTRSGKFVALIAGFVVPYLEDFTDLPDLTVIPDTLVTANGGFLFPKYSELNLLISKQIIRMRESGIVDKIMRDLPRKDNATMKVYEEKTNLYLDTDNVAGVFYIAAYGGALGIATLAMEMLVPRLNSKRRRIATSCSY